MEQKKKCRYCGAELPESADFCPVCAKSQVDKQVMTAPRRRWKRPLTTILAIVLVLAVVGVSVWQIQRLRQSSGGKRYEGDAQIYYTDGDGSYNLFLCSTPGIRPVRRVRPMRSFVPAYPPLLHPSCGLSRRRGQAARMTSWPR